MPSHFDERLERANQFRHGFRAGLETDENCPAVTARPRLIPCGVSAGSFALWLSLWRRDLLVTIAAPPMELGLRRRCRTLFEHPHCLPDRIHDSLGKAEMTFAHDWLAFLCRSRIAAVDLNQLAGCFGDRNFRERYSQHLLIGSVHDFDTPASPVLAILITFSDQGAGLGGSGPARCLKIRIFAPFGIFDEVIFGADIEVVKCRFGLRLRLGGQLVGRMT